jgi:hypothetical protein
MAARSACSALAAALAAALLAVAASQAAAPEFPKLKAGLWTAITTTPGYDKGAPRPSTLCLDDSVQQDMYRMSVGMMAGLCSKRDLKVTGNKVTSEAVCDLGMTKMRSSSVMTLTGDTAYHTEVRASFDPPLKGTPRDSLTIIDGRHVGECKEGQQPGDMTLPNGQQMNIRNWMSGKKG